MTLRNAINNWYILGILMFICYNQSSIFQTIEMKVSIISVTLLGAYFSITNLWRKDE